MTNRERMIEEEIVDRQMRRRRDRYDADRDIEDAREERANA